MKKLSFLMFVIGSLIFSETDISAKNDIVLVTNQDDVIAFTARFTIQYSIIAKKDTKLITELDNNNYSAITNHIIQLVETHEVDPKTIIPYLKAKGSLQFATAYKKLFLIYFNHSKGLTTLPSSIFYIVDDTGRYKYVEFKNTYGAKHTVYDGAVLSDIMITKKMLRYE
jgi:hypothetical protein